MIKDITKAELESTGGPQNTVSFREAFAIWVKVAIYSFGGPAGQIAVMHKLLVEEKRWVSESRFLHALNYCMLLPGPEAQQLATYLGWLLHDIKGGLLAGSLFVLPGFVTILLLSVVYAGFQEFDLVQAIFFGLKAAVMAVVLSAVIQIGRRILKNEIMIALAVLAFVAIFFFNIPFPFIVLSAAATGYLGGKVWSKKFIVLKQHSGRQVDSVIIPDAATARSRPSLRYALRVLAIGLSLWFGPLIILIIVLGWANIFVVEGLFFSQTAVVTFGGAYAVLTYIAQQAVEVFGWLQPGQMLDGLGMAETTPGPLIQVVQFVGFMGAYHNAGALDPFVAGILGSIVVTWVTFVPCFLWIFLGAPYIEYLRDNKSLTAALSGVTAAVVGVILNLAVWFSLHTVFATVNEVRVGALRLLLPDLQTMDIASALIAIGAFIVLFRYKKSMIATLAGSAAIGFVYYLLFRV